MGRSGRQRAQRGSEMREGVIRGSGMEDGAEAGAGQQAKQQKGEQDRQVFERECLFDQGAGITGRGLRAMVRGQVPVMAAVEDMGMDMGMTVGLPSPDMEMQGEGLREQHRQQGGDDQVTVCTAVESHRRPVLLGACSKGSYRNPGGNKSRKTKRPLARPFLQRLD